MFILGWTLGAIALQVTLHAMWNYKPTSFTR